jgi:hypothetical protein
MKKSLLLVLGLVSVMFLASCRNQETTTPEETPAVEETTAPVEEAAPAAEEAAPATEEAAPADTTAQQ